MENNTPTVVSIVVVVLLIIGGIYWYTTTPAQSPSPEATSTPQMQSAVSFPTASDILNPGSLYTLQWSAPSNPTGTSTQIFLIDTALESQGESVSISDRVYNVPDTGTYEYTVPTSTLQGTYRFEIGTLSSDMFQVASSSTQ